MQLTTRQLAEWEAFFTIEPLTSVKDDFRFAYLATIISNLMIGAYGKKGSKLHDIKDFIIDWDPEDKSQEQQSVEQMREVLMALAARQNT